MTPFYAILSVLENTRPPRFVLSLLRVLRDFSYLGDALESQSRQSILSCVSCRVSTLCRSAAPPCWSLFLVNSAHTFAFVRLVWYSCLAPLLRAVLFSFFSPFTRAFTSASRRRPYHSDPTGRIRRIILHLLHSPSLRLLPTPRMTYERIRDRRRMQST